MRKNKLVTLGIALVILLGGGLWYAMKPEATVTPKVSENPLAARFFGLVPPGTTSPFHAAISAGAQAEADRLGLRLDVRSPKSEGDFTGQATILKQLLDENVTAVSVNPIQAGALTEVIKEANNRNIPVLMHNLISPFEGARVTAYIGYDQWAGADKLGRYACDLLAKKRGVSAADATGKVFILKGLEGLHAHRRTEGFKAGLAAACPKVVVVGEQSAEWLRDRASEVATDALRADPDIDVFYGNSDEMGIGAAQEAARLGLIVNKDFFVLAIDGNEPTLELIRAGKFTATLGVDPKRMGGVTVDTMDKLTRGEQVPEVLLTPSVIVTADNLDDYVSGKTWTEPVAGTFELDNGQPTVVTP
jgi:ribose transport system substrate-binding protein